MARIPTFENRESVNTGAGFMRFQSANALSAPGDALARLGGQITGVGEDILKADERINAAAKAQADKDDNLRVEDALLDYDRELNAYTATSQEEEAGDAAAGYSDRFAVHASERAKALMDERFPGRANDPELQLRFERARQQYVKGAARYEVDRRIEWRDGVLAKKLDSLESNIGGQVAAAASTGDEAVAKSIHAQSSAEWDRVIEAQFSDQPQLYAIAKERGQARIDKSFLAARAASDKKGFIEKMNGAYSGMPAATADKKFIAIHDHFSTHGVDPKVGGAIFKLESDLGRIKDPGIDPVTGKKRSSATGDWQILDGVAGDLGIRKDQRNDFNVTTPAIASHLSKNQSWLQQQGLPVTPGTTYMTWNVGPGATAILLRADRNADVADVLRRAWRSQGPEWIDQALRNNPKMYKPGMTVGQVLANYEAKMAGAIKDTDANWTGVDSDSKARAAVQDYFPAGTKITGADIGEIFEKTATAYKSEAKDAALDDRFNRVWEGDASPAPSDPDYQKAVDKNVSGLVAIESVTQGDPQAHRAIVTVTDKTRYVPEDMARALSDTVLAKGLDNPGKAASYLTMARIADDYPEAFDASKFDGEVKKRVKEFTANTDVLGLPPAEAMKRVEQSYSVEGKKQREVMAERVREELKNGKRGILKGRDVTWEAIEDHYGVDSEATPTIQKEIAVDAYERAYTYHREQGLDEEAAATMSLKDMERSWGATNIGDGATRLSAAPIEKNYPSVGGHKYIEDEARNHVKAHLADLGLYPKTAEEEVLLRSQGKFNATANPEFRVVATSETMSDIRTGKQRPRYSIMLRRPDGMMDRVPGLVRFDVERAVVAKREADYAEARKRISKQEMDDGTRLAP